jgi:hypothetical protein
MSSPELHLTPDHDKQLNNAASLAQPGGSESGPGLNTTTPSHAESLLAAEKRTLEMIANGASLPEVLNDLCASIDAHASPVTSMVLFGERRMAVAVCRTSCPCHIQGRYHSLADRSRQSFLRCCRIHQTKGNRSEYLQRSAVARWFRAH